MRNGVRNKHGEQSMIETSNSLASACGEREDEGISSCFPGFFFIVERGGSGAPIGSIAATPAAQGGILSPHLSPQSRGDQPERFKMRTLELTVPRRHDSS
jgi:hypothetical protein